MAEIPTTARARARAAMTDDIKRVARQHLIEHGAAGLSLRAVARDLGVVSSAVYRYVASRDELLTMLIIDAFDAIGAVAEDATSDQRGGFAVRWARLGQAVRAWALANPHDYALIYGTPVAGYQAPADTVDPALRVTLAAIGLVADGVAAGDIDPTATGSIPRVVRADFDVLRAGVGLDRSALPDEVLGRALLAWTGLLGHLSYELFGHLHGGISDYDAFFEHQLGRWAALITR